MSEQAVKAALEARNAAQEAFREQVRRARSEGATIAQLQEWTGYSRRMVFYLLKDQKPA